MVYSRVGLLGKKETINELAESLCVSEGSTRDDEAAALKKLRHSYVKEKFLKHGVINSNNRKIKELLKQNEELESKKF